MIALRTMFATLIAVLAVGSFAQTNSSSSTGSAGIFSSSSIIANNTFSSSSAIRANSSSAAPSLSSSSSGSGPIIPGMNSSSSSVWIMSSSSSTGSSSPIILPPGTQEVTYMVELASGSASAGLADALARDFAATVAANPSSNFNVTAETIYQYIRVRVQDPATNQTISTLAVGPANTTVVATVLGNVTNVLVIGNAHDLAISFANAAQNGSVIVAQSAVYGVRVYPQTVVIVESPSAESSTGVDGGNGASSVASASLLIGSMIAALALAF